MPAKFTILQYLPNPATEERVNIGVMTFSEKGGHVRFLSRWDRVKAFSGHDVSFLKDLSKEIIARVDSLTKAVQDRYVEKFDTSVVESWVQVWSHSVEWSTPRASMLEPIALLTDICGRCLSEPQGTPKIIRDRKAASQFAAHGLRRALDSLVGEKSESLLQKKYQLPGKHQRHHFDAAIANGVPYIVATGVSFEGPHHPASETFFNSLAWAVSDCAATAQAIPIAVVALPPKKDTEGFSDQVRNYDSKRRLYTELGAVFVPENEYEHWAKDAVSKLPAL